MERHIAFMSENFRIEGLMDGEGEKKGVVITHPHPLYGGDMRNPVVECIQKAYRRRGFATLRFDFRGAGQSQGRYDEGRGEGRDLRAAVACLTENGVQEVDLAGYSFGAWINALVVAEGLPARRLIMVSPPAAFIDFASINALPILKLVVTGSRDDIAPVEQIRRLLPRWNAAAAFEVIQGCDHFYSGYTRQLEQILGRHIGNG